jgi:hypothetical protein
LLKNFVIKIDSSRTDKYEFTSQGFLVVDMIATREGVFDYYDSSGKPVKELRPANEVFDEESLKSLKNAPITMHHPDVLVTVDNLKDSRIRHVGHLTDTIVHDGKFVKAKGVITDKDAIDYVMSKKDAGEDIELSCGYTCDVNVSSGSHPTEGRYDAIQTKIRYNHISIVDKGRAGKDVKIKFDKENKSMFKFLKNSIKLQKFTMDSIDVEIPAEAKSTVDRLSSKLDEACNVIVDQETELKEASKKNDELQASNDELKAEVEKLKKDNADLSDPNSDRFQTIVKDREGVESVAKELEVKTDGLSIKDVKIAVIKAKHPDFVADEKSEDYINARYDSIAEILKAAKKKDGNDNLGEFNRQSHDSQTDDLSPREKFIKDTKDLHKSESEKK